MRQGTFGYPGGKSSKASWILEYFPEHHLYAEPFGGSAGVLVNKPRSTIEVYNDFNGHCVNFFEVCRDQPEALEHWVRYMPYSRQLFENYVETVDDWPDNAVTRAGRFYYVQCASFGGMGILSDSPSFKVNKYDTTKKSETASFKWDSKTPRIADIAGRFKSVNIEHLDYRDLLEKYDAPDTFFYMDPPYQVVGDEYYQVEEGGFDHEEYVGLVTELEGKWLISYNHDVPAGLEDYHVVERDYAASMSPSNPRKVETLTMNYDPDDEPLFRGVEINPVDEW